jgi:hypothetical protein
MKLKLFTVFMAGVLSLLFVQKSYSSVTLGGQYATLFESNGSTPIPVNSIGLLVADTNNDGLADPFGLTLSPNQTFGVDNLVIGVYQALDFGVGVNTGIDIGGTTYSYSGPFAAGDDLWLMWFPSLSTAGSVVGGGVSYGQYRSDSVNTFSGADIAFVAPPDGNNSNMSAFLDSIVGGGGITPTDFTASQTTVPEPNTWLLTAVGLTLALTLRRRRARA